MKLRQLFEASYDGMIAKMKQEFPDQINQITQQLKQAKQNLKKDNRIVWFMKLVRNALANNTPIPDITNLAHYFLQDYQPLQNYDPTNKTYDQVITDLNRIEREYLEKQKQTAPLTPQPGDKELIKFNDGTAWWLLDRAYCRDEARSGGHCGNVEGQHKTDQRILSFRKAGHVLLTFILEPNGFLGEMKAKHNQKPQSKFHPHIMKLLLWDRIKGIQGAGYARHMNFSIFDLDDKNLKVVYQTKPVLITTQISAEPMDFMQAPDWLKSIPELKRIAVDKLPGLTYILDGDWDSAIKTNPDLIIYQPNPDREKLIKKLLNNSKLLLKCNKDITNNLELMTEVIEKRPGHLQYVLPTNPHYDKLSKLAVTNYGQALKSVPEELRTLELCKLAVKNNGSALGYVPLPLRTSELCKLAVKNNGSALEYVPESLKTSELCKLAVTNIGLALRYVPESLRTFELCKLAITNYVSALRYVPESLRTSELYRNAVKNDGSSLVYVPEELKTSELCQIAVNDDGNALKSVPESLRTSELCKLAVTNKGVALEYVPLPLRTSELCKLAVKNNGNALAHVPLPLRTSELCKLAVKNDGGALVSVPLPLRTLELCKLAVENDKNGWALHYIPDHLKHHFNMDDMYEEE